jgi:hypothetical protein
LLDFTAKAGETEKTFNSRTTPLALNEISKANRRKMAKGMGKSQNIRG